MTIFENKFQFLTFCLTIIIWITHKKNIKRLFKGQETKINLRKNKTN
jgi:glycerol-3-phosphate acyltransferase PlsY